MRSWKFILILGLFDMACKSAEVKKLEKAFDFYSETDLENTQKKDERKLTSSLFLLNTCQAVKPDREKLANDYNRFCSSEIVSNALRFVTTSEAKYASKKLPGLIIVPATYKFFDTKSMTDQPLEGLKPEYQISSGRILGFRICGRIFNFSNSPISAAKILVVPTDPFGKPFGVVEIVKIFNPPIEKNNSGAEYIPEYDSVVYRDQNYFCTEKYYSDLTPDSIGAIKIFATEIK